MAITNFTAAEMHGQGQLGPTLTKTVQLTFTNILDSNNQYPAGYLILQGNATADSQLIVDGSTNIGEQYFFVGDDGEWSTKATIANNMTNTIAIPVSVAENDGSPVTQGILYKKIISEDFGGRNYLMAKNSGGTEATTFNLLEGDNGLGIGIIGYDPANTYDRGGGFRSFIWTEEPELTELICTDQFGDVVGPPFGSDADFILEFDNDGAITKIYLEQFGKEIPIALGLRVMVMGPQAEEKYRGIGLNFSDSRCLKDEDDTESDPYYVVSTGNFALKMEDV